MATSSQSEVANEIFYIFQFVFYERIMSGFREIRYLFFVVVFTCLSQSNIKGVLYQKSTMLCLTQHYSNFLLMSLKTMVFKLFRSLASVRWWNHPSTCCTLKATDKIVHLPKKKKKWKKHTHTHKRANLWVEYCFLWGWVWCVFKCCKLETVCTVSRKPASGFGTETPSRFPSETNSKRSEVLNPSGMLSSGV